ncbi:MerR family DNA-binding transcriptional regulator [Paraburkholderia sp. BL6669N2]|uniref:MerR family DNA-binding transcriptional regulator n=1 Tax=Paraburkholderia sp. BL6669N2 TaxID=1938807 RepID=UPI000E279BA0
MQLLSIGEVAAQLGVAVGTLRRWHRRGRLEPFGRTVVGHRRYGHGTVRASQGGMSRRARLSVTRASSSTVCMARAAARTCGRSKPDAGDHADPAAVAAGRRSIAQPDMR